MLRLALLAALASLAAASPAPNVRGTVTGRAGGSCPVGEACDPLPPPFAVVFVHRGTAVRVRIRAGAFATHLAAGRYTIRLAPPAGVVTPASVVVPRRGVVRLHLRVTG